MTFEKLPEPGWNPFHFFRFWLLTCLALVGGCGALLYWADGDKLINRFDCGNGRQVVITAASTWEISQPLYYSVRVNGRTVVPRHYFSDASQVGPRESFQIILAEDDNLIGIYDRNRPYEFDIIHDFATNRSWPKKRGIGDELRKQIESEHPQHARIQKLRDTDYLKAKSRLFLDDAGVNDNDLSVLKYSKCACVIHLERNNLTDNALIHLRELGWLQALYLKGNNISPAGITSLKRALPNTRIEH